MSDERKIVSARDLPASLAEAPPTKRNSAASAEVSSFAKFGNISPERARHIMESKDGRTISAIAKGLVP